MTKTRKKASRRRRGDVSTQSRVSIGDLAASALSAVNGAGVRGDNKLESKEDVLLPRGGCMGEEPDPAPSRKLFVPRTITILQNGERDFEIHDGRGKYRAELDPGEVLASIAGLLYADPQSDLLHRAYGPRSYRTRQEHDQTIQHHGEMIATARSHETISNLKDAARLDGYNTGVEAGRNSAVNDLKADGWTVKREGDRVIARFRKRAKRRRR